MAVRALRTGSPAASSRGLALRPYTGLITYQEEARFAGPRTGAERAGARTPVAKVTRRAFYVNSVDCAHARRPDCAARGNPDRRRAGSAGKGPVERPFLCNAKSCDLLPPH